jgi:enoyl-CoA hydratase
MTIDLAVDGAIGVVTINQPERLNALNTEALASLIDVLGAISLDRSIRAVILTGAGERAFVAGADIAEMASFSPERAREFGRLGHASTSAIENLPQPVIAAVNGFAFGGGCELALAADIRICSVNAEFAQPEVKLGIPPGWGGTQRLPRIVSPGIAAELMLTGRRVKSEEALRIGIVNSIHHVGGLMQAAKTMAGEIARNSPNAVRMTKRLLNPVQRENYQSGLAEEARAFARAFEHPDQSNGMTAFVEKRVVEYQD